MLIKKYLILVIQSQKLKKTTTDVKRLLTNTTFDTKTGEVENKIPDVRRSIFNTVFDTKSREI